MADRTLIIAVAGVVMSGVVGPTVTAWAARVSQRKQFLRDREGSRRDELLSLCDEAATLLALGPVRLRQIRAHAATNTPVPDGLQMWSEEVFAIGQRLVLRLGPSDDLVTRYEAVRVLLAEAGEAHAGAADEQRQANAVLRFEAARGDFLDAAKRALHAPVSDAEPKQLTG